MAATPSDTLAGALALIDMGLSAKDLLALLALSTVRIYAALLVLPATSDQLLHGVVRNGLALTLGLFVALGQPAGLVQDLGALQLMLMVLQEALVGALIGFAMSIVFWAAEAVGMLIDNIAGFNAVQQTNPLSGQSSTPLGTLLGQLAVVGFYTLGGMMVFTGLLLDSHRWWPLGGSGPRWSELVLRFVTQQAGSLSEIALKIAGPVLVTLVLIDLGLGLVTKAAEKLEPGALTQPIKGASAVLMVVLLVAVFFDQVRDQLSLRPQARQLEKLMNTPMHPR